MSAPGAHLSKYGTLLCFMMRSYCRFITQYDPRNKRRKSRHSQQKQSHKLKSYFQFPWHTLKVFNFACINFCERLKFSNSWVFSFASHHNRTVPCVLNFAGEIWGVFCLFFLIFLKKLYFGSSTKRSKITT